MRVSPTFSLLQPLLQRCEGQYVLAFFPYSQVRILLPHPFNETTHAQLRVLEASIFQGLEFIFERVLALHAQRRCREAPSERRDVHHFERYCVATDVLLGSKLAVQQE